MLNVIHAELYLCLVSLMLSVIYPECHFCWVSSCWVMLFWVSQISPLCWMLFCWISQINPLCWVLLGWMSLCWVSWRGISTMSGALRMDLKKVCSEKIGIGTYFWRHDCSPSYSPPNGTAPKKSLLPQVNNILKPALMHQYDPGHFGLIVIFLIDILLTDIRLGRVALG